MKRRIQFQLRVEPGSRGRSEWITRPNREGALRANDDETNDLEPEIAEFMREPWLHRTGLDSYEGINSRMPADQNVGLFWNRGALTPPQAADGIVDDAIGRYLVRTILSDKAGHR